MRKTFLAVCLAHLAFLPGCKVCEALISVLDLGDGPPAHTNTQAEKRQMWEWESRQFQDMYDTSYYRQKRPRHPIA